MFATPGLELRSALLELKGPGPKTVDAILLYTRSQAFFVADAYTRRVLARQGMLAENATYAEAQNCIHLHLRRDANVYDEFHALLVEVANATAGVAGRTANGVRSRSSCRGASRDPPRAWSLGPIEC